MSALVVSRGYVSNKGRKPARAAFSFDFHNDAAGGTAVVDRFGNAANLTLQGTLGTAWTAMRGFWRPGGADTHAIPAAGGTEGYAAQNVIAPAALTPGNALFVAWRFGWVGSKTSSNECILCVGRSHSSSALLQIGHNSQGILNVLLRGVGASTTTGATFGSSGLYNADTVYSGALHLEATATGVAVLGFLDGVNVGTQNELAWTANGGTVPVAATWASPDGLTVGAQRGGSTSGSPTFTQRIGATAGGGGGSLLANLRGVNLGAANASLAADLALELHQYPRYVGEILDAL